MIVQSQLDGQLYEVPDTYGGLSGYQEYVDPGLGLPFLAALIPKVAAIAGKALPMVAKVAGSVLPGISSILGPGQAPAANQSVRVAVGPGGLRISPALVDALVQAVRARTQALTPPTPPPAPYMPRRRRRRRNLNGPPGYGYYGYAEPSDYGWPGY